MPTFTVKQSVAVPQTSRVKQLLGMFDVPPTSRSENEWEVELPIEAAEWNVGLIFGPSGCGKTTIARKLWGDIIDQQFTWPARKSIVDAFPKANGIKEITGLLSSVGFSSPPAWLRPFHALSNGEQFRVSIARLLAECPELAVVDEFTSIVDRTTARIGSAAIAKTVRRLGTQFVAVSCHDDVIEWLDPDWTFCPADGHFDWRRERRRPEITIDVAPVHRKAWRLFAHHHYLSTKISNAARCFVGSIEGRPAVFSAVINFPGRYADGYREHRTVCLPDFQGVGIGNAMSELIASAFAATGRRYTSVTSHPAMIRHRARSKVWNMRRKPSMVSARGRSSTMRNAKNKPSHTSRGRLTASFTYVGEPNHAAAEAFDVIGPRRRPGKARARAARKRKQ